LLKYIEEYQRHILISGFKNAKIKDIEKLLEHVSSRKMPKTEIQFLNAYLIATWQHLYFAVLNALVAFKNKQNISKSLAMETILYASAQRQIRKAVELLGIKSDTSNIAVVAIGENPETLRLVTLSLEECIGAKEDETVLELSDRKTRIIRIAFEVSDLELETVRKGDGLKKALVDLIIERMALLATQH